MYGIGNILTLGGEYVKIAQDSNVIDTLREKIQVLDDENKDSVIFH